MKTILFVESFNCSPHIETAFELAKNHLINGDIVHFYFVGHALEYSEKWSLSVKKKDVFFNSELPENIAAKKLMIHKNFHFKNISKFENKRKWSIPKIHTYEDLIEYRYNEINIGLGIASSIVSKYLQTKLNFESIIIQNDINNGLTSAMILRDFAEELFLNLKPKKIYIFNGRFCNTRPLYELALIHNVQFQTHERGSSMNKYELYNTLPHDYSKFQENIKINAFNHKDRYEVFQENAKLFFHSRRFGKPKDWISFTSNQKAGKLPTTDKTKKIITYFQSSDDEYIALGELFKWKVFDNQIDAFNKLSKILQKFCNIQLILRIHPNMKNCPYDLEIWSNIELPRNSIYVGPEDEVDSYALLEVSDLVIVSGSTVGIESVFWGKPTISLGPSLYSELNAVFIPESLEHLEWALLNIDKLEIGVEGAIMYGAYMNEFGIDYKYYKPFNLFSGEFLGKNLQKNFKKILGFKLNQIKFKFYKIIKYFGINSINK